MLNSRNIDDLRSDVAANCRLWQQLCKQAGLAVLVTGTVRDEEYQMYCYNNGTSKAKVPSFHSVKAGLAFDFCKNVKGHEFDDLAFFSKAAAIAKKMGFEWGGDWTSFPDRPHLQWSAGGTYTSAMVRAGKYPPAMPLYRQPETVPQPDHQEEEDEDMVMYHQIKDMPDWAQPSVKKAVGLGVIQQSAAGEVNVYEPNLQTIVLLDRLGLFDKGVAGSAAAADQAH